MRVDHLAVWQMSALRNVHCRKLAVSIRDKIMRGHLNQGRLPLPALTAKLLGFGRVVAVASAAAESAS